MGCNHTKKSETQKPFIKLQVLGIWQDVQKLDTVNQLYFVHDLILQISRSYDGMEGSPK